MTAQQITSFIVFNVFAMPGFIIAAFLRRGKGADLIAGYNTAAPEERAKWDEKALSRGVGILVLLMVGCIELTGLGAILDIMPLTWGGIALLVLVTTGGLVYINTSKRFRRT